jgi:hypothetical protein
VSTLWPWVALAGLGAFHGLNPAMGWLFAVARGLQQGRREVVLGSMIPIAAGHALSVAAVVLVVGVLRLVIDLKPLQIGAAGVLIGFGVYRLLARHWGRRAGMQVGAGQLVLWSFLMASVHGAGLMLIPVLLGMPLDAVHGMHALHAGMSGSLATAVTAVGIHTAAMLMVAGAVALAVYQWIGVAFLRRSWVNLDFIWVPALFAAGAILLAMALVSDVRAL